MSLVRFESFHRRLECTRTQFGFCQTRVRGAGLQLRPPGPSELPDSEGFFHLCLPHAALKEATRAPNRENSAEASRGQKEEPCSATPSVGAALSRAGAP